MFALFALLLFAMAGAGLAGWWRGKSWLAIRASAFARCGVLVCVIRCWLGGLVFIAILAHQATHAKWVRVVLAVVTKGGGFGHCTVGASAMASFVSLG